MAAYATRAELQIRIQILSVPSADQIAMMEALLDASSRAIDRICGVDDDAFQATGADAIKYLPAYGETYLRIPQCVTITTVAVKASVSATTYTDWATPTTPMAGDGDWIPCRGNPEHPEYGVTPYDLLVIDLNGVYSSFLDSDGLPVIKITAAWGTRSAVPADIREACLMQAAKWYKKFQGAQASDLGTDEFGRIRYARTMDSGVKQILVDGRWILPLYGGA